jgi:acyl-CoA synthetase (NDP forming)
MDGALVQAMAAPGVEMIVGALNDREFGPIVLVGMGGTAAELLRDRVLRIAPIGPIEAGAALRSLRTHELLTGYRGAPAADTEALVDVVVRVGLLAHDVPELAELDLNPVIAGPGGVALVDARARIGATNRFLGPIRRRIR